MIMKSLKIKLAVSVIALLFTVSLSAQRQPPHQPKSFPEQLAEFVQDCDLPHTYLLKKFEQQIYHDYEIDFEFREDDIEKIISGVLMLPPSFQRSFVRVMKSPTACKKP